MGVQPDIVFGRGGRELRLDLFTPLPEKSLRTAVLQLHAGSWRMGDRKMLWSRALKLSELGFTCCTLEYRLVPEAPWPAQLHDVKAAIRWVRAHAEVLGIESDRIVLQGYSAGGHLALMAAGTPGWLAFEGEGGHPGVSSVVAAVMAFYPPTAFFFDPNSALFGDQWPPSDVEEWKRHQRPDGLPSWVLLGHAATEEEARRAGPFSYLSPQFPPTFLVHGTADTLPFQSTLRFHQALLALGATSDLHLFGGSPISSMWQKASWISPRKRQHCSFAGRSAKFSLTGPGERQAQSQDQTSNKGKSESPSDEKTYRRSSAPPIERLVMLSGR